MKEIKIYIKIDEVDNKIATLINHKGFTKSEDDYSVEQILETVGILEHIKQQQLSKLSSIDKRIK